MQILSIKFENLNSLYGEWSIDLTDPRYLDNGIFLISGPTGAGKTTILDAICLALYGQTPRLGKIAGSNEIMSKGSKDCYADVLFQVEGGVYRSRFKQHISKGDKLQPPKLLMAHSSDASQQWDKRSEIDVKIVELTGMDFKRFTQTVMLAQGQFDAFLKTDTKDKSKILEQVTGTGIYADISIAVHKRNKEEKEKCEVLANGVEQVELLSEEEQNTLKREINNAKKIVDTLKSQREQIQSHLGDLEKLISLKGEVDALETTQVNLAKEWATTKEDRDKFNASMQALEVEPIYASLMLLEDVMAQDSKKLEECKSRASGLVLDSEKLALEIGVGQKDLDEFKDNLLKFKGLSKKITELDNKINNLKQSAEVGVGKLAELSKKMNSLVRDAKEVKAKIHIADEDINRLKDVAKYKHLPANYLYLKEKLEQYYEDIKNEQQQNDEADRFETEISEDNIELKRRTAEIDKELTAQKRFVEELIDIEDSIKIALGTFPSIEGLLVAYKDAKSNEEVIRENINIVGVRSLLVDGEACPVCGSTEHPYATEDEYVDDEGLPEVSKVVKDFESRIDIHTEHANKQNKLMENRVLSNHVINVAKLGIEKAKQRVVSNEKQLDEHEKRKNKVKQNIKGLMLALKEFDVAPLDNNTLGELTKKYNLYERGEKDITLLNKGKAELEGKENNIEMQLTLIQKTIDEVNSEIAESETLKTTLSNDRYELFKNKVVEDEEEKLNKLQGSKEHALNNLNLKHNSVVSNISSANSETEGLYMKRSNDEVSLATITEKFAKSLEMNSFESVEIFLEARIPQDERLAIKGEIETLKSVVDSNKTVLDNKLAEITNKLYKVNSFIEGEKLFHKQDAHAHDYASEQCGLVVNDANVNDADASCVSVDSVSAYQMVDYNAVKLFANEFKNKVTEVEKELDKSNKSIGMIDERLENNSKKHKDVQEKVEKLKAQKKIAEVWKRLNEHIGSHDGTKYRGFVQGLAFKLVINNANIELGKMRSRYRLTQHNIDDVDNALELDVIDLHSLNEVRTIKNVSGGESFIISLALALGLASMFSNNVNALFLDEGFSTLDEDSLDQVLSALSNLHSSDNMSGKMVGIISHVPALKESIDLVIDVKPVVGGRSVITVN